MSSGLTVWKLATAALIRQRFQEFRRLQHFGEHVSRAQQTNVPSLPDGDGLADGEVGGAWWMTGSPLAQADVRPLAAGLAVAELPGGLRPGRPGRGRPRWGGRRARAMSSQAWCVGPREA